MSIHFTYSSKDQLKLLQTNLNQNELITNITEQTGTINITIKTHITHNTFCEIAKEIIKILGTEMIIYYSSKDNTIKYKYTPTSLLRKLF